jgi:lipopolysaccharide/colanic/teichoic acid biosynthesis glycosyltransferase
MARIVSIVASALLLVVAAPIIVVTALLIWLEDGRPVFYRQSRAGLRNQPFQLVKFRSMRTSNRPVLQDTSQASEIGRDHPLVTRTGRWIRRSKIDELPQLLNVLFGEMALIGPRPTVLEQTSAYSAFEMRRLALPPGMTGWTQINGGTELSWPERILLDVWYVDHRTVWLDLKILWRTAAVIISGEKPNPAALQDAIDHAKKRYGQCSPVEKPASTATPMKGLAVIGVER